MSSTAANPFAEQIARLQAAGQHARAEQIRATWANAQNGAGAASGAAPRNPPNGSTVRLRSHTEVLNLSMRKHWQADQHIGLQT